MSNLSVRIPEYIQRGDTADLTCSFNLGGDKLYSVKWYKGRHEFYRYMPNETPVIKTFPVKGMEINVSFTQLYILFSKKTCYIFGRRIYHMLNYLQNFLLKVGILLNSFFKNGAMMHYIREQAVLLVMIELIWYPKSAQKYIQNSI